MQNLKLKSQPAITGLGTLATVWGVCGFLLLLTLAIYRLTPIALGALQATLYWYHWLTLFANILFMAYSEGYRGFQKSYSPRLVGRARQLAHNPSLLETLFAPLFCMCFFGAQKRRVISAWLISLMIAGLVAIFHYLPQPWRGVLDAGVVVGLCWGLVATILCFFFPAQTSS